MLKITALILMFVDHVGYVIEEPLYRLIGRLCLPLIVHLLIKGWYRTSDQYQYMIRLCSWGIIAQIPYILFFDWYHLNILLVLPILLIITDLIDRRFYFLCFIFISCLAVLDAGYNFFSYPVGYLVALVIISREYGYFIKIPLYITLAITACYLQSDIYFILAFTPLLLLIPDTKVQPRCFFYAFYPLHLPALFSFPYITAVFS